MKNYSKLIFTLISILVLYSCHIDTDYIDNKTENYLNINIMMPKEKMNAKINSLKLTLKEINTGKTIVEQLNNKNFKIKLPVGLYKVEAIGDITYKSTNGIIKKANVYGIIESITISNKEVSEFMYLHITNEIEQKPKDYKYKGFVLAEIFCAGTSNNMGGYYYADKYFRIYNNTNHTLYADSIAITESAFLTVQKEDYKPNIMNTDFTVDAIYMIPGRGHDVAVKPGESLLLVDNAINHTKANPNSWDETKADFEWYDESTNPQFTDVDNPNVPNLNRIFSKTATVWSPHTQGFKSYAIIKMKEDKDNFLKDHIYNYNYHIVGLTGEADMNGTSFKIPNSWVIDAVNMSAPKMFQWIVTSPILDRGYTYSSLFGWDDSRFNKSVRRKVAKRIGQRAILVDTNNSTNDFEPRTKANPYYKF